MCRCDFGVYAVFDGHGGSAASKHCKEVFLQLLVDTMPLGAPPPESNEAVRCWRRGPHALNPKPAGSQ